MSIGGDDPDLMDEVQRRYREHSAAAAHPSAYRVGRIIGTVLGNLAKIVLYLTAVATAVACAALLTFAVAVIAHVLWDVARASWGLW